MDETSKSSRFALRLIATLLITPYIVFGIGGIFQKAFAMEGAIGVIAIVFTAFAFAIPVAGYFKVMFKPEIVLRWLKNQRMQ